ncbi:hypothetical protein Hamer_G009073 [Homarus americanus]|uniref:Uncharacterized protein n=1 Tax=Homarus americanus TaxID=6706 RepID=A0A8J5NB46_HOMAM|nr:hypothetical protein Hamer_G009073 [Homarus americanus]
MATGGTVPYAGRDSTSRTTSSATSEPIRASGRSHARSAPTPPPNVLTLSLTSLDATGSSMPRGSTSYSCTALTRYHRLH